MRTLVSVLNTHIKSQTQWHAPVTPVLGSRNFGILGAYWLNNLAKMASSMFNKKKLKICLQKEKVIEKDIQHQPPVTHAYTTPSPLHKVYETIFRKIIDEESS